MTYLLEQLGDERFQQLCQALLTNTFPDVQCLPIGQPDGGRDALHRGRKGEFIIFQVKFVHQPSTREARDSILQVIQSEKEKVEALKRRGAKGYYFLTNVSGTSHLDVGSIDKLNSILTEQFGIPSFCWWRDDIERRIDCVHEVKWSYPEILKGTDVLAILLKAGQDPEAMRRSAAIRSYMAAQSQHDAQLKFKQIDLQKDIFDLFVDVPAKLLAPPGCDERTHVSNWLQLIQDCKIEVLEEDQGSESWVGALDLLVSAAFGLAIDKLVVEGAPGQGKSTITQYLCQVNRLKLLGREHDRVLQKHLPTAARIPFRVDLRDYASWLGGRDPFSDSELVDEKIKASPLLESFIAAQVHRLTGMTFTVDDLNAVAANSRILIVLDGFDEVADIKLRNRIVSEVSHAAVRIKANAIASQIVVTSRPAVFSNSPGFPRDEWSHLEILPLTPSIIESYAMRWLDGRQVDDKEKRNVLSVLKDKITHAHVRDLARNPMQLSILLALISVQGASLPDKRTALYDEYIKIFLNRESEKSTIVRDHRGLLINIHQYLAWVLQSESESDRPGNISETRLKEVLYEYLNRTGNETELVEKLFTGMVERVVALVSRIQGTFEFEVQPLREYFAARYLYDTAPNVPATVAKGVGKPERFEAIARNFYWLNVTRFYAGCYTSGELASLIDGLRDLRNAEHFKLIGYPAELALVLFGDYVFNNQPRIAAKLAGEVGDSINFPICLAESSQKRYGGSTLQISQAGCQSLENRVSSLLLGKRMHDVKSAAGDVLSNNWSVEKRFEFWMSVRQSFGDDEKQWLNIGSFLRIYRDLPRERLRALLDEFGESLFPFVLDVERSDVLGQFETFWPFFMRSILSHRFYFPYIISTLEANSVEGAVARCLGLILCPFIWEENASWNTERDVRSGMPIGKILSSMFFPEGSKDIFDPESQFASDPTYGPVYQAIGEALTLSMDSILNGPYWARMIEACRNTWGDAIAIEVAACNFVEALAIDEIDSQLASTDAESLVHRALLARKCAEEVEWWREQLLTIASGSLAQKRFFLTCVLRWMPVGLILELSEGLSRMTDELEANHWTALANDLELYGHATRRHAGRLRRDSLPRALSPRLATLLMRRMTSKAERALLWRAFLQSYDGAERTVWYAIVSTAVENTSTIGSWRRAVSLIAKAYELGLAYHFIRDQSSKSSARRMPPSVAEMICTEPNRYPLSVVSAASEVLTAIAGERSEPVANVARRDGWFAEMG